MKPDGVYFHKRSRFELQMRAVIPNIITLLNILCGLLIIVFSFHQDFELIFLLAVFALIFDFFDGTVARLLKAGSTIGKDLDSLADVISFGVAPAMVLYNFWLIESIHGSYMPYLAFILPLFAAYRLAIFNNTVQSAEYFKGLATPALAAISYSIPLASSELISVNSLFNSPYFILIYVFGGSFLMLSSVRFLSFKIGSKNKLMNSLRIGLILTGAVLVLFLKFFGVILCLLLYLVISLTVQKRLRTL